MSRCFSRISLVLLFVLLASALANVAMAQGLTISGVAAGNVTDSTAVITWTTNATADSRVNYGNTTSLGQTQYDGSLVINHSVTLTGLDPLTTYYYEVVSGNTTDNNGGSYYTFETLGGMALEGWAWSANSGSVVQATFVGLSTMVERAHAGQSYSMHAVGNLTLQHSWGNETVPLDLHGSRARSLFYLRQEVTGISVTFTGGWISNGSGGDYMSMSGLLMLPNPEGQNFKTARVYLVLLRTPDVEVPIKEPGTFVEDVESLLSRIMSLIDKLLDELIGYDFRELLSAILTKMAVLAAAVRDMGTPYIP